ncbi:flagellar hook-basal body complex protein FliE [Verrucomicrobium sp. GAS474]|uniref:flagellar hook-basal body complex protein FliE n=1 Tax=Verrucomicrobium sp. GAS474 TaxID=1882831 RepID=UPI00087D2737|nr:flagellar hook-basal body complex protein FliE [Verrucomicrobium sp. GAS474]SDU25154.1 flagellar hook-basal body complex protein FliE [Verrucomicrobium sp. GAS474]
MIDFISALSSVTSAASGTGAAAPNVVGNHMIQQGNGMSFSFELPKPVGGATPAQGTDAVSAFAPSTSTSGLSSADGGGTIVKMINSVNDYQASAGEKVRDVLMGGKTTLDEAMVASQESSVAFKLLAEMRNKAVDSYQEVMRMQI